MMRLIRLVLGKIILALDAAFSPKPLERLAPRQNQIEEEIKSWRLYQLKACPFCVIVRREMKRLNLKFEFKEIGKDEVAHRELMAGGKIDQVPCLMIPANGAAQAQWIYESKDIVEFLRKKFV